MRRLPQRIAKSLIALAVICAAGAAAEAQQQRLPQPQQQRPQQAAPAIAASPGANQYPAQLVAEGQSRQLCEGAADRVFVRHDLGSECIAYFATAAPARPGPTVLYFEGDVPASDLQKPNFAQNYLRDVRTLFPQLASRFGVRFVFVSRPGVFGSSGSHGQRRSMSEMLTMNAAVDAIKARLGLNDLVLAGQSGGSTIGAALLTLGRRDVSCAILGSGLLSVVEIEYAHRVRERLPEIKQSLMHVFLFDPTDRLHWIERQQGRRIFVLGDPTDTRTPFPQQRQFAERVRGLGHHAVSIEVMGQGDLMHGVAHHTLPAAAHCARGSDDATIRRAVAPSSRPVARTAANQTR